jgi:hypothetical protein
MEIVAGVLIGFFGTWGLALLIGYVLDKFGAK